MSRTERPRKTKIGTEVAYVTHNSDTTFKVKSSKVKVTGGRGHIVAASRTACYRGVGTYLPGAARADPFLKVRRLEHYGRFGSPAGRNMFTVHCDMPE